MDIQHYESSFKAVELAVVGVITGTTPKFHQQPQQIQRSNKEGTNAFFKKKISE